MYYQPTLPLLIVSDQPAFEPLLTFFHTIPGLTLASSDSLPQHLGDFAAVAIDLTMPPTDVEQERLAAFVHNGGGCLGFVDEETQAIPNLFGVRRTSCAPRGDLRVLFQQPDHPIAARLPDAFYANSPHQPLETTRDDVKTLLYADWRYSHSPVLTLAPYGAGSVACITLSDYANNFLSRILFRTLRWVGGELYRQGFLLDSATLGVGLLGYSPAVGQLHGQGSDDTAGLVLRAACDLNPARQREARQHFPHVQIHESADELAADDNVDLVIVTTPPSTHAKLAIQMLAAGKHVIVEKPMALTQAEVDAMLAAAERAGRHVSCHQNRRWDVDYRAIKHAVDAGQIGELFHAETFVGGFDHPCGYWHSHDAISGGTTFDWGAHYLDWLLTLLPETVTQVTGTRHKRVWHDVTNADQERIGLRFAGGQEMEFTHSDIAAARKPKWYLLGTRGAIVGQWRDVTSYAVDPLHYFDAHEIPATEMSPELTLHQRISNSQPASDGQIVQQSLPLPAPERYAFHRNLADHLLLGEPLEVTARDSARVVAVLEAAARSAENDGWPERVAI